MACAVTAISFINSNQDLSYGFIGGQVFFIILGSRHAKLSSQHLDRALWQYNKEVLFPEKLR
jgi:hypothetical protein